MSTATLGSSRWRRKGTSCSPRAGAIRDASSTTWRRARTRRPRSRRCAGSANSTLSKRTLTVSRLHTGLRLVALAPANRRRFARLQPIGVGCAVPPHRVHDNRALAGDRHHRLLVAALGDLLAPALQRRLALIAHQHGARRLVERAPDVRIAGPADPPLHVDRGPGLPALGGQAEIGGAVARAEARRVVDRRSERQCGNRTDAGDRHEAPAELVVRHQPAREIVQLEILPP